VRRVFKIVMRMFLVLVLITGAGFAYLVSQYAWPINIPLGGVFGELEADQERLDQSIHLPEGFTFTVYATGLKKARMMLALPNGDLLVSTPASGQVHVLAADKDGDGKADRTWSLIEGLSRPHGLALHEGYLYIAEDNAIGRAPIGSGDGDFGPYERIVTGLTSKGNHWSKTIDIGPDGKLYMSSGSTCNVCEEEDPRRAAMMRFDSDGKNGEILATGLRNSVGFDWAPDGTLYATENSRDLLGDDFPPEEFNKIEKGKFYGWPYVNGFGVLDPDFGPGNEGKMDETTFPAHGFKPHNAPLGMTFVTGDTLPADYQDTALVALHGSWNRSQKDGYKVVSLHFDGETIQERDFMTGFLTNGKVIGRPVDVEQDASGALYVSDDYTGTIYKLVYGGEQQVVQTQLSENLESETFAPELIAEGQVIFEELGCAGCHAPEEPIDGNTAPKLENLAARYTSVDIGQLLDAPPGPMPRFDISDQDKKALAAYILSTY
jgi:glucose/arabinose dehydrogenase/cytochrome c551/c552